MTTNHDNAFFLKNPEPDDGCYLITPKRSATDIAALNARLATLPEPSARFVMLTQDMARLPIGKKVLAVGRKTHARLKGGDVLIAK